MTNVNGNAVANLCREWRRAHDAGKHGAAYDAAFEVVELLVDALKDADPRVVQAVCPAGGPLDRTGRQPPILAKSFHTPAHRGTR